MRRNCNLELALFPPCDSGPRHHSLVEDASEISPMQNYHHRQEQQQPLTIFYDGKICVADVTELQAKSILMLANKRMEQRVRTASGSEPSSPTTMQSPNQLYSPGTGTGTGLSMRKSLQRFLHKRKIRAQEASPYHH
ncbi:protein TIFY 5A [Cajanus cajan]|uniref:Protein TIFY n=1 Tax=Cajanus cajan TaxID=3821 RepID=A0A151RWB6_CAJCA|nr:protein TIFY 5A [Cajanus cajan]KYP46836.1 Protein TIFY 5A [Cajanus cajan]